MRRLWLAFLEGVLFLWDVRFNWRYLSWRLGTAYGSNSRWRVLLDGPNIVRFLLWRREMRERLRGSATQKLSR
jgi:hypothetical protein